MTPRPLALVEPRAHRAGGHHQRTLTALARAHGAALVVAPHGATAEMAAALDAAGARLDAGVRGLAARMLRGAADTVAAVAEVAGRAVAGRRGPVRRVPHQITLLARCLAESACVRSARRRAGPGAIVVVLSASEALHGLAGLVGGPHTRFVHEMVTTEDRAVRLLSFLTRRGVRRVRVLVPTAAVRADLAARFPRLPVVVRPFAVADPDERITAVEQRQARAAFAVPPGALTACLVGGWWTYKDIPTVGAALERLDVPLHLIVTGYPLDLAVLTRWAVLPHVHLHVVPGPASDAQVRTVYAASDAAIVARRPGVGKESGLVVDAVRFGVGLVVSDHAPALTVALSRRPWVRTFRAEDGEHLAAVLHGLVGAPLPRPPEHATRQLAIPTAAEQTAYLLTPPEGPVCSSRPH